MTYRASSATRQEFTDSPDKEFCPNARVAYARHMTARLEDTALMLRYRDGDVDAFEVLYRRHNDALYRYLLRLSREPAIAEDLFQETWQKIIRARTSYRPVAKFSTYLFRVAHNCFIDHVRRIGRRGEIAGDDLDTRSHPGESPERTTERALARRRLESALLQIPAEQKDVYLLYEEAGLGIDEIALVTGINRETAKSRLRYAVKKLKAALEAEPAEGTDE